MNKKEHNKKIRIIGITGIAIALAALGTYIGKRVLFDGFLRYGERNASYSRRIQEEIGQNITPKDM